MPNHPFEEHIPGLRRYARALLRDRTRADDLVQDTLERALNKFSLFRRDSDLRAWLFTVMHNVHVNQIRSASNRMVTIEYNDSEMTPARGGDVTALHDLANALERLLPEHREVLVLIGVEQFSYEEAARVLDVPIGTVMSRLSRARERLSILLEGGTAPQLRRVK
ncbi:MAG: RNA polymerase subunit sigma-24 [Acidithiobacillales bacterium SM1_46]|jgi:RNA polymerase sigma-70 factor (ECF subfamily)|nr:MAG: RNA polymerase subunit sigma-24 [Acidithiobacillales bacterium SM1_46]